MTRQGAVDVYMWMMASWPNVIKPGASEAFMQSKVKQLFETYTKYTDQEVMAALHSWAENNEKFPTTKNILNEMMWLKRLKFKGKKENVIYWPMDVIYDDGTEWTYGSFKREDFVNHHRNPDHLQPEEWERRFRVRRREIMARVWPVKLTPSQQRDAEAMTEHIRRLAAYHKEATT